MSLILQDGSSNNSFSAIGDGTAYIIAETLPIVAKVRYGLPSFFTVATSITGSPTGVEVVLQGSIDGVGWFNLGNTVSTSNDMFHVVNKGIERVRAKVSTLSGGTAPTVTIRLSFGK